MKLTRMQSIGINIGMIVVFLAVSWWTGSIGWASLIGGASGLFNVWLTAQENIWNYPVGFVNVAAWFYLFHQSHLFADAWLQVFFGILMAWGWYMWLTKRENKPVRPTTHIQGWEIGVGSVLIIVVTYVLGKYLVTIHDIAPYTDAFVSIASIVAQYLLSKKVYENWFVWIGVDVIEIVLYFIKHLAPTAVVYIVFLLICIGGWWNWRKNLLEYEREKRIHD